jgi:hypothetical protein
MLAAAVLVVSHVVALGAGALARPHVTSLVTSYKASRSVAEAKKLVANAEAAQRKLDAARKLVNAAVLSALTTGTTGPTGA